MDYIELSKMINDAKSGKSVSLNKAQKESLYSMLASRCRQKTKDKLARIIFNHPLSLWSDYGIYRRVHVHPDKVFYCAGQSYPDEIRTVRQCVLEG